MEAEGPSTSGEAETRDEGATELTSADAVALGEHGAANGDGGINNDEDEDEEDDGDDDGDDGTDKDAAVDTFSGKKRPRDTDDSRETDDGVGTEETGPAEEEILEMEAGAVETVAPAEEAAATVAVPSASTTKTAEAPALSSSSASAAAATAGNVSAASVAAAAQLAAAMGWTGLSSLLGVSAHSSSGGSAGSSSSSASAGNLPTVEQVLQAATKCVNEAPPFCHLSKADSAPQLKISNSECAVPAAAEEGGGGDAAAAAANASAIAAATINDRLACKGGMRGYRMTRASHGVGPGSGNYYYEVLILEPPSVSEIVSSLPSNVRMGKKLQQELQQALLYEEENKLRKEAAASVATAAAATATATTTAGNNTGDADPTTESDQKEAAFLSQRHSGSSSQKPTFGAHVRLGWSMRTGDLQAPVGYDKWSFGLRDIGGSKIHCSRREDHWGGEEFGPGDVVGCAISMVPGGGVAAASSIGGNDVVQPPTTAPNSANGTAGSSSKPGQQTQQLAQAQSQQPQGQQNHIRFFKNGTPMGEFIISKGKREGGAAFMIPNGVYYPAISLYCGASVKVNFGPNFIYQPRKLPTGMKLQPMSSLCKAPIAVEDALIKVTKEKTFRKADMQQKFLDLVRAETQVLQDAYQSHRKKHLHDVIQERKQRNLKTDDLESDDFYEK